MKLFKKKIEKKDENVVITRKNELDDLIEFTKNSEYLYKFKEKYIRKFVDKTAIWYQLKYPYESSDDLYSTSVYLEYLPHKEKVLLKKPSYVYNTRVDKENYSTFIDLTSKGIIKGTYMIYSLGKDKLTEKDIKGKHIKYLLEYIKENNLPLSKDNELEKTILEYENSVYFKEELLRSVCYQMLKNDKSINGVYRCILFINEFHVKINDVLFNKLINKYNIDIINKYLDSDKANTYIVNIEDEKIKINNSKLINLLKEYNYDIKYYPKEEYQKLVNILKTKVTEKDIENEVKIQKEEKIKQLRIERKLNK